METERELSSSAFAHSLGRLRDEGTTILVVGAVGSSGHRIACDTFRGVTADPEVLIGTQGRWSELWPPKDETERRRTLLAYDADWRAAAVSSPSDPAPGVPRPQSVHETPESLAEAVESTVSDLAPERDTTRLRLCMESVSPLLANHPRNDVIAGLERIRAAIRSVGGFGHVHLPVSPQHAAVSDVSAAFRCQVELERSESGLLHRWLFPERDATSGWYRLSSAQSR